MLGIEKVQMLPAGNAEFARKMGMLAGDTDDVEGHHHDPARELMVSASIRPMCFRKGATPVTDGHRVSSGSVFR